MTQVPCLASMKLWVQTPGLPEIGNKDDILSELVSYFGKIRDCQWLECPIKDTKDCPLLPGLGYSFLFGPIAIFHPGMKKCILIKSILPRTNCLRGNVNNCVRSGLKEEPNKWYSSHCHTLDLDSTHTLTRDLFYLNHIHYYYCH
jgi:hypothetical protein